MVSIDDKIRQIVLELLAEEGQTREGLREKPQPTCFILGKVPLIDWTVAICQIQQKVSPEMLRPGDYLLLTELSLSDLAKIALGIADTLASSWVAQALAREISVYIVKSGLEKARGRLAYQELFVSYERKLAAYGVTFTEEDNLAHLWSRRESSCHEIVTLSDLDGLEPYSRLELAPGAIVTYAAKEKIKQNHLQLCHCKQE